jgi:hypothetical protein
LDLLNDPDRAVDFAISVKNTGPSTITNVTVNALLAESCWGVLGDPGTEPHISDNGKLWWGSAAWGWPYGGLRASWALGDLDGGMGHMVALHA